jgi:hypothetical protein
MITWQNLGCANILHLKIYPNSTLNYSNLMGRQTPKFRCRESVRLCIFSKVDFPLSRCNARAFVLVYIIPQVNIVYNVFASKPLIDPDIKVSGASRHICPIFVRCKIRSVDCTATKYLYGPSLGRTKIR